MSRQVSPTQREIRRQRRGSAQINRTVFGAMEIGRTGGHQPELAGQPRKSQHLASIVRPQKNLDGVPTRSLNRSKRISISAWLSR